MRRQTRQTTCIHNSVHCFILEFSSLVLVVCITRQVETEPVKNVSEVFLSRGLGGELASGLFVSI